MKRINNMFKCKNDLLQIKNSCSYSTYFHLSCAGCYRHWKFYESEKYWFQKISCAKCAKKMMSCSASYFFFSLSTFPIIDVVFSSHLALFYLQFQFFLLSVSLLFIVDFGVEIFLYHFTLYVTRFSYRL